MMATNAVGLTSIVDRRQLELVGGQFEPVALTDERDGGGDARDGVGDHDEEDGERQQHGDTERDLFTGVRRQREPHHD